ncbi:hypothetical protein AB0O91_30445 [Kitasatospora sp. NPDC089797]|uniref:phage integrase central domain-containing protein n=1 Tax=Kitasatospora sp. NPDC089797 TaxID=3155298 RepID=UPI00342E4E20
MRHAHIEDRGRHADYQKAVARALAAGRTPPARYRVRWFDDAGNRRSWSLPTRRIAEAAASDLSRAREPITLNRLVDLWAAAKPEHYRRPLDRHVLPALGQAPVALISRVDILRVVNTLYAEAHLSPTTINRICATLRQVLASGVEHLLLPSNPADGIRIPVTRQPRKLPSRRIQFLSPAEHPQHH